MVSVKSLNAGIICVSLIGIGLSYYSYFVETKVEQDANYKPMCDISEHMSCTKAFMSEYGKGLGLVGQFLGEDSILNQPNGLTGMIVYSVIASLCFCNTLSITKVLIGISFAANIASVYLAYILYFILSDFCVVCVTTYLVNFVCLVLAIAKHRALASGQYEKPFTSSKTNVKKRKTH